jgi:hypothetical protein
MIGFRELEAKYGPLPDRTRKVMSPSGSVHRYFQHPGKGIKIVGSNGVFDRENGGPKKIAATIRSAFKGRGL